MPPPVLARWRSRAKLSKGKTSSYWDDMERDNDLKALWVAIIKNHMAPVAHSVAEAKHSRTTNLHQNLIWRVCMMRLKPRIDAGGSSAHQKGIWRIIASVFLDNFDSQR